MGERRDNRRGCAHSGEQDMACDTFIKIAQKCRRQFVTFQLGELTLFVDEIIKNMPSIIRDLRPHQVRTPPTPTPTPACWSPALTGRCRCQRGCRGRGRGWAGRQTHTFYEAVGYMIQAQSEPQAQERLIARFMELPNTAVRVAHFSRGRARARGRGGGALTAVVRYRLRAEVTGAAVGRVHPARWPRSVGTDQSGQCQGDCQHPQDQRLGLRGHRLPLHVAAGKNLP